MFASAYCLSDTEHTLLALRLKAGGACVSGSVRDVEGAVDGDRGRGEDLRSPSTRISIVWTGVLLNSLREAELNRSQSPLLLSWYSISRAKLLASASSLSGHAPASSSCLAKESW